MPESSEDIRHRVLQRLQSSSVGLSSRDLARSLRLRPNQVTSQLLDLQRRGLVKLVGTRWRSVSARSGGAGNVTQSAPHKPSKPPTALARVAVPASAPVSASGETEYAQRNEASKQIVDKNRSRWSTFRQLCQYYAECVRLDQRSSIHAKADEENKSIVCLDGQLPELAHMRIRTRESWHEWTRKLTKSDHLFVGYPLHRYRWRDPQSGTDVDFVTPIFLVPCRYEISNVDLTLNPIGSARVNEGWLERRLKNLEERRAFLELCGTSNSQVTEEQENAGRAPWGEYARLLRHYFPDWCAEELDPTRVCSQPALSELQAQGVYNRATLVIPKKWKYTIGLHKELIQLAHDVSDEQLDQSALRHLFPHQSPRRWRQETDRSTSDDDDELAGAQVLPLNREQLAAVEAAGRADLSVIVGPPGTGKSRVVAAALGEQALRGRSALFASRNHQALEAVVPRVNALTEPWPIMLRLARPWGAPPDASLEAAIRQLVTADVDCDRRRLDRFLSKLPKKIAAHRSQQKTIERIAALREELAEHCFELEHQLREVPEPFRVSFSCNADLPTAEELDETIDRLSAPAAFRWSLRWLWKRVVYQSRLKHALVRARALDDRFRQHFDSAGALPAAPAGISEDVAAFFGKALTFWKTTAEANFTCLQAEKMRGKLWYLPDVDSACREKLKTARDIQELSAAAFRELAHQAGAVISDDERSKLAEILATMENRSALDTEEDHRRWRNAMQKSFPIFLRHFPLVATTNLSVGRDINLQPGVFDLLIIDEASQCDVASIIPLLFRSRRAMVVGDPMQLSHVTTLSPATDRHLRRQFRIDTTELERFSYRTSSAFHLSNTTPNVTSRISLRQHHRCHPSIAEYCSDTFYKGTWSILTNYTKQRGLVWTHVPDDSQTAPGGGAVGPEQGSRIAEELHRLASNGFDGTLGVVTPFRQQANRLQDHLHQLFSKQQILNWRLLVDTADGFQGDERDVVLFSLVAGPGLSDGSMRFLAGGPNRFNVAVSRARQVLHVFGDIEWARACKIGHIRALAEHCDRAEAEHAKLATRPFRDDLVGPVWEPALAEAMRAADFPFYQQYPACGRFLDFALLRSGLKLDIEVDGETYHRSASGDRFAEDISRDQALVANGWKVMRFWVYELREDMDGCIQKIREAWEAV